MPEIPSDPTPAELSRLRSGIRIMALHDLRNPELAEEVAQDTWGAWSGHSGGSLAGSRQSRGSHQGECSQ